MTQKELTKDLQDIIDICKDSVKGYETAADKIEQGDLQTLFLRLSQQRKGFVEEIKNEALKLGTELDESGSTKGFFHRTWLATKAVFSRETNEKVINESMQGEKVAVENYNKILGNENIPRYLREILEEQQKLIKGAILQLNGLKAEV
ncbi:PA2169 family four-helix-bundle protein [uncultured Sunxiuqinia sp.]|uniref:ferritin-like domain-containing protein n=1 Tax=uncultured Sunxiuqinia sp. TaxID=1573825 RepID=UPI002AA70E63|nr:PA2169 family four-helix-bundle protein [uncultured Sunxiuqinia sp.]